MILKPYNNGIKLIWINLNNTLKELKKITKIQLPIVGEDIIIKCIIKYKKH
jgi:hypothetical protein